MCGGGLAGLLPFSSSSPSLFLIWASLLGFSIPFFFFFYFLFSLFLFLFLFLIQFSKIETKHIATYNNNSDNNNNSNNNKSLTMGYFLEFLNYKIIPLVSLLLILLLFNRIIIILAKIKLSHGSWPSLLELL